MKSKTLIEKQLDKKSNPELVETIIAAKKGDKWLSVAGILSTPKRNRKGFNLSDIDKEAKEGDIIIVAGKVLSNGEVSKKIKVAALNFSEKAKEKLLNAKCDVSSIIDEIKKNPEANKVKILYSHSSAKMSNESKGIKVLK